MNDEEILLRMRNPYPNKRIYGKYQDYREGNNNKNLTQEVRNKLSLDMKPEGVFYLTMEEFLSSFESYTICCYEENYAIYSQVIEGKDIKPHKS